MAFDRMQKIRHVYDEDSSAVVLCNTQNRNGEFLTIIEYDDDGAIDSLDTTALKYWRLA